MDKYLDVKDMLMSYRVYKDDLDFINQQIKEMEEQITTINSTSIIKMDDVNGMKMYMKDYVNKIADLKIEYERRYTESLKKWMDVRNIIDKLKDPLERRILFAYYCGFKRTNLYKISREWNYSTSHIKNKHREALSKLQIILDKESK